MRMTETLLGGASLTGGFDIDLEAAAVIRSQRGNIPGPTNPGECPWCGETEAFLEGPGWIQRGTIECPSCQRLFLIAELEPTDTAPTPDDGADLWAHPAMTRQDREYIAWLKQTKGLPS